MGNAQKRALSAHLAVLALEKNPRPATPRQLPPVPHRLILPQNPLNPNPAILQTSLLAPRRHKSLPASHLQIRHLGRPLRQNADVALAAALPARLAPRRNHRKAEVYADWLDEGV